MRHTRAFLKSISFTGLLFLGSCGGISQESRVASTVQTLLVMAVEMAMRYQTENPDELAEDNPEPLSCSGGGSYSPVLSAGTKLEVLTQLISGDTDAETTLAGSFNFDDCVIKVCGRDVTLTGTTSEFSITGIRLDGSSTDEDTQLSVTFTAEDQGIAGPITGEYDFEYVLNADAGDVGGSFSITNLEIEEASTPAPLTVDGITYSASQINNLADGC